MYRKLAAPVCFLVIALLLSGCGLPALPAGPRPDPVASPSLVISLPTRSGVDTPAPTWTSTPPTLATATPTIPAAVPATVAPSSTPIVALPTDVQYVMAQVDVNIRSGPGTGYQIIGWLAAGQIAKVNAVSSDGGWWQVICPDDTVGSCWLTAGRQFTQPTAGPVVPPTLPAVCTDAATYVADVTVPDNAMMPPNHVFVKTWRVRNNGTCTWDSTYALVFKNGDRLSATAESYPLVGSVAPGATVDLSAHLTAPVSAGTFQGFWEIRSRSGGRFGVGRSQTPLWVKIIVENPRQPDRGSISGYAWQDANGNNAVDWGELLANVSIALHSGQNCRQPVQAGFTDLNGRFTFSGLAAGSYCLTGSDGVVTVSQAGILLAANQSLVDIAVTWPSVLSAPTIITGLAYEDSNQNGLFDAGEPGAPGREVRLIPSTSCHVSTPPKALAFTGPDGRYTFSDVIAGAYCVGLAGPDGLEDVLQVVITRGETLSQVNLRAARRSATIEGILWHDACFAYTGSDGVTLMEGNCVSDGFGGYRADGVRQSDEAGLAGVTIRLRDGACTNDSTSFAARAVTDAGGRYAFTGLAAGTYCVYMNAVADGNETFLLPGDWTYPGRGIWYHPLAVTSGQRLATIDFGWDYQLK